MHSKVMHYFIYRAVHQEKRDDFSDRLPSRFIFKTRLSCTLGVPGSIWSGPRSRTGAGPPLVPGPTPGTTGDRSCYGSQA